jgi:hypothetical protein
MFIQLIQGTIADADLLRRQTERWERELEPGAAGFLGSTSGVTPDGRAIILARFESEADARANRDRPEPGRADLLRPPPARTSVTPTSP